ncbi:MAG: segregation and condensation protein A, partial [Actinomycetota bacterium]
MDVAIAPDSLIPGFHVRLENFDGPFDLLLQLIAKHKMDVTEVALATVTDEFIGYIRKLELKGEGWDLDKATEFLVVAATLLDLKAARLLPSGEIDDESDLALLEARDLLFARLLQYRAFKQIASLLEEKIAEAERSYPRTVSLEPHLADLLPEVVLRVSLDRFAALAERALSPRDALTFSTAHLHLPLVSVAEEGQRLIVKIMRMKIMTFRAIAAEAPSHLAVIARFLALLELFREGVIRFQQVV